MAKPLKITLIALLTLLVLLVIGYFAANSLISSKLENFFKTKLPEPISIDYESLDVNIMKGNIVIINTKIINKGLNASKNSAEIKLDTLIVEGFGYWNYLVNDDIHVKKVKLGSPKLIFNYNKSASYKEHKKSIFGQLKQKIEVDQLTVQDAELSIREIETDSLMLFAENMTLNLMEIQLDSTTAKQRIPFEYDDYNLSFKDFTYSLGKYENLEIAAAQINQEKVSFEQIKLFTKYSKEKLNQIITVERDHFDITIPSLVLENHEFGFDQNSVFYFKSPKVIFENPEMHIYRNKLKADDLTEKHLYSRMLRDLKFKLTLSEVELKDATIVYSEKVHPDTQAGKLSFSKLNADIKNVSNTYGAKEKTTLDIHAIFMARTPIKVNWEFDVNDVNDGFVFKADIGKLPSADMNPFSRPNLRVLLEGELLRTYATISGNVNTSRINMRINYEQLKVEVMQKKADKKNKVVSAVANLFIKKNTDKTEDHFKETFKEHIERDKTKSIFNFLWINLKAGLISIVVGHGK